VLIPKGKTATLDCHGGQDAPAAEAVGEPARWNLHDRIAWASQRIVTDSPIMKT
jgi:hypothetical protein